jgi:hypothetical protein
MSPPARTNVIHVLLLDFERGTITRYAKHRGLWTPKRLQHAQVVDTSSMDSCAVIKPTLEHFRTTGRTE